MLFSNGRTDAFTSKARQTILFYNIEGSKFDIAEFGRETLGKIKGEGHFGQWFIEIINAGGPIHF